MLCPDSLAQLRIELQGHIGCAQGICAAFCQQSPRARCHRMLSGILSVNKFELKRVKACEGPVAISSFLIVTPRGCVPL